MIGLLSIPTWLIHFGSVYEWGLAMILFYRLGRRQKNKWFRRMPLFMLPYGLSGLCAIAYHISYDTINFFSDAQAYLTFAGSCAFALWAFLILRDLTARLPQKVESPAELTKLNYSLRSVTPENQSNQTETNEVQRG